jgi:acyl-CoA dehydrogenase
LGKDFFQDAPTLGNQWDDDPLLREHVARQVPGELLPGVVEECRDLGELGGGELFELQLADLGNEPELVNHDAWGHRVDAITLTPLWDRARALTAERGLVAQAYDGELGEHARTIQFARNHLVQASLDVWCCPLAMTDGAARTLIELAEPSLVEHAVPRLTSRDPAKMWTSGQWMTERTGGSDVGTSRTVARKDPEGWRLHGDKWFTSAATAEMALTLARPEGNPEGGRGLALFYLEVRDADGALNGLRIHRLKDKLGTKKVPTAELTLDGTLATAVAGLENGTRNITPMLNITRMWNSMGASWGMRRALALVLDFSGRRTAFGDLLSRKPLHVDTVAGMQAEYEAGFHLAFRVAALRGRLESGTATERERLLARVITPIAKLTTGKQAVAVASEALECFGGAGYVEDTGLPRILADAQVLPIWEGTTNVLSLDTLRALRADGAFEALLADANELLDGASDASLGSAVAAARDGLGAATAWIGSVTERPDLVEAGARRFALTLGRSVQLALLASHAEWCLRNGKGPRAAAAARRFATHGVNQVRAGVTTEDSVALCGGS